MWMASSWYQYILEVICTGVALGMELRLGSNKARSPRPGCVHAFMFRIDQSEGSIGGCACEDRHTQQIGMQSYQLSENINEKHTWLHSSLVEYCNDLLQLPHTSCISRVHDNRSDIDVHVRDIPRGRASRLVRGTKLWERVEVCR